MPVSLFPFFLPIVFVILLIQGAVRGRKAFVRANVIMWGIIALVTLPFYIPGWWLMLRGSRGNGAALYQLARWHENHSEKVGALILWPWGPDVKAGYRTLERAAATGYPTAVYALGVRFKFGHHVPQPPGWTGASGNVFPQPERGQPLIDQALRAGLTPTCEEKYFYWHEFRGVPLILK